MFTNICVINVKVALVIYSFKKGSYKHNNIILKIFIQALKNALKILKCKKKHIIKYKKNCFNGYGKIAFKLRNMQKYAT